VNLQEEMGPTMQGLDRTILAAVPLVAVHSVMAQVDTLVVAEAYQVVLTLGMRLVTPLGMRLVTPLGMRLVTPLGMRLVTPLPWPLPHGHFRHLVA